MYLKNDGSELITVNLGPVTGGDGEVITTVTATESSTDKYGYRASRIGVRYVGSEALYGGDVTEGTVAGSAKYAIFEPHSTNHFDGTSTQYLTYYGVKAASGESPVDYKTISQDSTIFGQVTTKDKAEDIVITVPASTIVAIEVYVWVEGQDIDCINAMGGSALTASLTFNKVG